MTELQIFQFTWTFHAHYGIGILCAKAACEKNNDKEKVGLGRLIGQDGNDRH